MTDTTEIARREAREETKPVENQEQKQQKQRETQGPLIANVLTVDLNNPGFTKDCGSVADPVGEIVDFGRLA